MNQCGAEVIALTSPSFHFSLRSNLVDALNQISTPVKEGQRDDFEPAILRIHKKSVCPLFLFEIMPCVSCVARLATRQSRT